MKACPYCAEQIQDAAVVCRFCGRTLEPTVGPAAGPRTMSPEDKVRAQRYGGAAAAAVGGLMMAIAPALPWLSATAGGVSQSKSGYSYGGASIALLVLGVSTILAAGAALIGYELPVLWGSAITTAVIGAIWTGVDLGTVSSRISEAHRRFPALQASAGSGITIAFVGCAFALIGGFVLRQATTGKTLREDLAGSLRRARIYATHPTAEAHRLVEGLRCPQCHREVAETAVKCRHCGADLPRFSV